MKSGDNINWRTPEELLEIGFSRSRVVIMNEAHNGLKRCIRTREIGRRILPAIHELGVRYLAMEALWRGSFVAQANRSRQLPERDSGYLSQSEMRSFVQDALDLGWRLIPYEANIQQRPSDTFSIELVNRREKEQAQNLLDQLGSLPSDTELLVWCGNCHGMRVPFKDPIRGEWLPMGYQFKRLGHVDPFVIDQTVTVNFPGHKSDRTDVIRRHTRQLATRGGTAGFLTIKVPAMFPSSGGVDAVLLSLQNELEWLPRFCPAILALTQLEDVLGPQFAGE